MGIFDRFKKSEKYISTNVKIKIECKNCGYLNTKEKNPSAVLAMMMNARGGPITPNPPSMVKCPECGKDAIKTEILEETIYYKK